MFEDSEYLVPEEAFKKAGHALTHIGMVFKQTVKGKKDNTPVKTDMAVNDAQYANDSR